MKIQAKFIGQNGSLGFIKGATYHLWLETVGIVKITPVGDQGQPCHYTTMRKFLNNWEIIE